MIFPLKKYLFQNQLEQKDNSQNRSSRYGVDNDKSDIEED